MTTRHRSTAMVAAERSPSAPRLAADSSPSIHVVRARQLLLGGLAGGVGAAVLALALYTVLDGTRGLASEALASAMVLFFYGV
ncbi:MAG: hypothetical protein L0H41_13020, partial [Microlunatus sp.]|nr:hypothetical protein [Microlunatus sp.]